MTVKRNPQNDVSVIKSVQLPVNNTRDNPLDVLWITYVPLRIFMWFGPYGVEVKLPQNIKQVGGIWEYPANSTFSLSTT